MSETNEVRALAIIPRNIGECTDLAERLAKSELLPKALRGKVPDVLMTIMAGSEMGLAPMASLRSFHVVDGKPVMGADGMVAVVLGSGKCVYFERVEESDTSVTYETLRIGSKAPRRCTWTIAMAKAAALHIKDNWRCYPRAMLASRAKAELARDVFPDVLAGCYTDDEIGSVNIERGSSMASPSSPSAPTTDAVDAEIVPDPPELAQITAAQSVAELKGLAEKLKELPDEFKARATSLYKARIAELRAAA